MEEALYDTAALRRFAFSRQRRASKGIGATREFPATICNRVVVATPAYVHDSQVLDLLLHGNETRVWGDSAYTGQKDRLARAAPKARDFTHARRPGSDH